MPSNLMAETKTKPPLLKYNKDSLVTANRIKSHRKITREKIIK
jgi:hypothetical protein